MLAFARCNRLAKALPAFAFLSIFVGTPVPATAQSVSLSTGQNCTYSSYSVSSGTGSLPNFTFTCSGSSTPTAAVSFGSAAGSLTTTGTGSATISVSCSGTGCSGVTVAAIVQSPGAGVTISSNTITNGAGVVTVSATGAALTPGNAVVRFDVPAGAGTGVTVTPSSPTDRNVPIVDPTTPGTIGFASAASSVVESTPSATIAMTRTGAGPSALTVAMDVACTITAAGASGPVAGYAPVLSPTPPGTQTWTLADMSTKSFTVTPGLLPAGATTGTIACTAGTITGGATPGIAAHTLTVTKAPVVGNCPATTITPNDLGALGSRSLVLASGTSVHSTKFQPTRPGVTSYGFINLTSPVPGYNVPQAIQIVISECPGDFTPPANTNCAKSGTLAAGWGMKWYNTTGTAPFGWCPTDPAKTYYLNARYVNPLTNLTTCADSNGNPYSGNCAVYADFDYH